MLVSGGDIECGADVLEHQVSELHIALRGLVKAQLQTGDALQVYASERRERNANAVLRQLGAFTSTLVVAAAGPVFASLWVE